MRHDTQGVSYDSSVRACDQLTLPGADSPHSAQQHTSDRFSIRNRDTSHLLDPPTLVSYSTYLEDLLGLGPLHVLDSCFILIQKVPSGRGEFPDRSMGSYLVGERCARGNGDLECCIWDQPSRSCMARDKSGGGSLFGRSRFLMGELDLGV
jgi:hypothetical protein